LVFGGKHLITKTTVGKPAPVVFRVAPVGLKFLGVIGAFKNINTTGLTLIVDRF